MTKYKVGIIGCGNISPMHILPVMQNEHTTLVAVCDIKKDRVMKKVEEFGCKWYTNYKEMFKHEALDAVHICTPHYLHPIITNEALDCGIHVLTEKPMAIQLSDAKEMLNRAEINNKALGVIFQTRYNAASQAIKDALNSGKLGGVKAGRLYLAWDRSDDYYKKSDWKGTWDKEGGGVIIDQAIHTLDLANWFINKTVDYIDAHISNRAHDYIEVEDAAEGVIKYKDGTVLAFHTVNYYTYDSDVSIELHCEKGIVHMKADQAVIEYNDGRQLVVNNNPSDYFHYGDVKNYWGQSHNKQIRDFYEAIRENRKPTIDGHEALTIQKIVCAIYESGKKNKKIYL
ncbi:Gfo/Idh/MocA family protein [Vallitalea okinawensis]|uniref:Gfo/Idh/MocA family protein n=1 Tax=Vallitalea okinawensis TaxID=2078660 RepID=UPI000CFDDFCD|nr:Gfo/Idh/MocA family oxidoreductase [Vallitalea okinawensis]